MKKIFLYISGLIITSQLSAQTGIGTSSVDASAVLQVEATDKGILLPQVDLTSLTSSTTPVTSPADGLLIYSTNATNKGFYMWSAADAKWLKFYDRETIKTKIESIVNYSAVSTESASSSTWITGSASYTLDETPSSSWLPIQGVSQVITITNTNNVVIVDAGGVAQINNVSSSQKGGYFSYAIGIFVGGKLKGVRVFEAGNANRQMNFGKFELITNALNIPIGETTVEVRFKPINKRGNTANFNTLTVGGHCNGCTNITDFAGAVAMNVKVVEYP